MGEVRAAGRELGLTGGARGATVTAAEAAARPGDTGAGNPGDTGLTGAGPGDPGAAKPTGA